MRFDSEAYEKVFPRKEPEEVVESVLPIKPERVEEETVLPVNDGDAEVVSDGNGSSGEHDSE